jgi:Ser/Thr protein kinase RdoA (MazF antagonist)
LSNGLEISAVLDFDDMTYAPLAACVAVTLLRLPVELQTPEVRSAYLDAYESVRPMSLVERLCLRAMLPLRRWQRRLALPPA